MNFSFLFLLVSMIFYWIQTFFLWKKQHFGTIGMILSSFSLFCLLILRWVNSGHFPLSNLYESLMFLSWSFTFIHLILENVYQIPFLGAITSPSALFMNAFATFSLPNEMQQSSPLVPALQSNWLMMHVTVMIVSYAALICGSLLSIAFLILYGNSIEIEELVNNNNFSKNQMSATSRVTELFPFISSFFSPPLVRSLLYPEGDSEGANKRASAPPIKDWGDFAFTKQSKGPRFQKGSPSFPGSACPGGVGKAVQSKKGPNQRLGESKIGEAEVPQTTSLFTSTNQQLEPNLYNFAETPALPSSELFINQEKPINRSQSESQSDSEIKFEKSNSKNNFKIKLAQTLDHLSYRILGLGFPFLTIGILSGAVWANEAWGSYWSWDPKETWALLTWLVFAIYLHTRFSKGWNGKKPAMIASFGFFVVWICYLGVNLMGEGLHSYGWIHS